MAERAAEGRGEPRQALGAEHFPISAFALASLTACRFGFAIGGGRRYSRCIQFFRFSVSPAASPANRLP